MRFLGGSQIILNKKPLASLKSRKGKALFCYLAVTGRKHSRSALSGLLWTDLSEENARANLRKTLSRIKPQLGHYLNVTRETISFNSDSPYSLDVAEFEAGMSSGSAIPSLRKSASLYKGDFLEGFDLPNASLFDEWVQAQRSRLRELALDALQTLVSHFMDHGEFDSGITYARRLLNIEPWHEDAHQSLMYMLALSGQRSSAIKQYEECQRIMEEELGVEPSIPTTKLFKKILQEEITPQLKDDYGGVGSIRFPMLSNRRGAATSNLPPLAAPLIGRQKELKDINGQLVDSDVRLVTITGLGGIGKTHLALTVSHQLKAKDRFREGVFFVPLSSITSRSRLISTIAESLGLSLTGLRYPEETLLDFLQDWACLLILDNFEQLLPEVDFLVRLLQVAPHCTILVTSRERLKLREEWVLDLEGLPYPNSIQAAQNLEYAAIHLFSERARQIRSSFSLENEISGVVQICQLTQGIPLALEQAACLIRVHSASEIAGQIEERLGALSTTLRNLPERHRSMRAVLDGSWRWLSEDEQKIFCRLSVFRGSFTYEAADRVVNTSLSVLTSLVDKSLLQTNMESGGTTRYELHVLIRQYAAERLFEAGHSQVTQMRAAHLEYYLSLAERAEKFWETDNEWKWLGRLEAERSNFYSALRWAIEQRKAEFALRLNAALWTFLLHNSPADEAEAWLESSLSVEWDEESRTTMQVRARVLKSAGYAAILISDLKLAEMRFKEAAELFSILGNPREVAWSLRGSGLVCLIQGDLKNAQNFMQESRGICREIQSKYSLAWAAYGLGNVALASAKLAKAESLFESAMTHFRQHGRELGIFHTLISLGHLRRAQGNMRKAVFCYKEALSLQGKTRYIHYVAQILEGLAHIAIVENNMETAVRLFGVAQARRDKFEMARWAHHDIEYQQGLALTRSKLSESDWQSAWDKGYMLPSQKGLEFAADVADGI
jgi:predicted ATPase/DNA-binding SARP family transcriptional activator